MLQPGELNHLYIHTHHLHYKRALSRFSAYGLGEGQPKLLHRLTQADGCSQVDLARSCNLKPATVTVNLTRMEKAGLVERRADAGDMRVTRIWLTKAGWAMSETFRMLHLVNEEECFRGFTAEEREQMAQFLKRMQDNLLCAEETDNAGSVNSI